MHLGQRVLLPIPVALGVEYERGVSDTGNFLTYLPECNKASNAVSELMLMTASDRYFESTVNLLSHGWLETSKTAD